MAVKAASQISIIDVTDAYSVTLTSEAYTFVGNTAGATSGLTCSTQVVAYCGNTVCKITVGTITCPIGISASVTDNGTVSPTITFKTTATISAACEATIPLTIDGVTITKKFSFAVAKTGATGASGKGIKSTTITYQAGASGKTAPTGTWVSSPPETTAALPYLWTRTVITYTDNTTSTSYSIGATPEGITVGGRNLAQGTSNTYYVSFSGFNGGDNVCFGIGNTLTDGLSVGDTISIKLVCKYTNLVAVSGKTPQICIIGAGNVTSWNDNGWFPTNDYTQLSGSDGEVTIMYQATINANHIKNSYWITLLRTDAIQSGTMQCKMFKVERGTKHTDWTPAPEDTEAKIALKVDEKSLKSAIEAIADTINITAKGGLNLTGNSFSVSSTNLTIMKDGSMTCKNLSVTGGSIDILAEDYKTGTIKTHDDTGHYMTEISPHSMQIDGRFCSAIYSAVGIQRVNSGGGVIATLTWDGEGDESQLMVSKGIISQLVTSVSNNLLNQRYTTTANSIEAFNFTWTVSGTGLFVINAAVWTDTTDDYGTTNCALYVDGACVTSNTHRYGESSNAVELDAGTTFVYWFNDTKTHQIQLLAGSTKTGTKTLTYTVQGLFGLKVS